MLDTRAFFDNDHSRRPPLSALAREALALVTHRMSPPSPADLPDGAGRPVLVIPAFLCGDVLTGGLRRFLGSCGFVPYGWDLGVNWGPTPKTLSRLEAKLDDIASRHGPVSLVGVSLGGLLARHLAHQRPAEVAHVVTIASPFRLPTASQLEPLVQLCSRHYSADLDLDCLNAPLPMPSTMIYTEDDGVVPPESCWTDEPGGEVVALTGAHIILCSSAEALTAIVRRLAP